MELKKLRKLVLEQQRELEKLQRGNGGASSRARELEEKLEMDYQIGEDIKEKVCHPVLPFMHALTQAQIIPRAVDYFTGKALEYDMLSEGSDEYEDEEDDEDGDGFDDDDDGKSGRRRRCNGQGPPGCCS